jgi:hypothetical protein
MQEAVEQFGRAVVDLLPDIGEGLGMACSPILGRRADDATSLPYVSGRAERPRQLATLPREPAGSKSLWS